MTLDDPLSFTANIAVTTRCCRFILHNIRRIRPFLTRRRRRCWCRLLSSHVWTTATPSSWSADMRRPTSAAHPECSGPVGLQPTQVLPHCTAPPHPALASGTGTRLPCCDWFKPLLHPGNGQTFTPPSVHSAPLLPHCEGRSHRSSKSRLFPVLVRHWGNELPIDTRTEEFLQSFCSD